MRIYYRGIQIQLSRWLLGVALVPLLFTTFLIVRGGDQALRSAVRANLVDLADQQVAQLNTYAAQRLRESTLLSTNPLLQRAIIDLQAGTLSSAAQRELKDTIRPMLQSVADGSVALNVFVIGDRDRVLIAAHQEDLENITLDDAKRVHPVVQQAVDRAQTLLDTDVTEVVRAQSSQVPVMYTAVPVFSGGRVVGAVVSELPTTGAAALVQAAGLGQAGEVLLAARDAESAVIVAPLRRDPNAALQLRFPFRESDPLPLHRAVEGEHGDGEAIDYRDEPVVAVWRYIPAVRWGMVVKIDIAEANAAQAIQIRTALLILGTTIIIVILLSIVVARSLSAPLIHLTKVAQLLTTGHLHERAVVKSRNEVGQLGTAINLLAETIEQRITEYETAQIALQRTNAQLQTTMDLVQDLEVPLIPLLNRALLLPLVGTVDTQRVSTMIQAVLQRVAQDKIQVVLIDLTALPTIDAVVMEHIQQMCQAIRLLGAHVMISGISVQHAQNLVQLDVSLDGIVVVPRVQDGIAAIVESASQGVPF